LARSSGIAFNLKGLSKWVDDNRVYLFWTAMAAIVGYTISVSGIIGGAMFIVVPGVILFAALILKDPKMGIWVIMGYSFLVSFFSRQFPGPPYGLGVDALIALVFLLIFLRYYKEMDFLSLFRNKLFLLQSIWMLYVLFQLFNPLAYSAAAWFYSMRGIALYNWLYIGLGILLMTNKKEFHTYMDIWFWFSLVGGLWGAKQLHIGVSAAEQAWLDGGEAIRHILFGQLRVFSYYFDAGTYGAAMGQVGLAAFIMALGPFSKSKKIFYYITGFACMYGLIISGTRGALAVPAIGGIAFLIMTRNVRLLTVAGFMMFAAFAFLRFTFIGQNVYQINRMRTALDPNDASLQVRLKNRARLTEYLRGKPFGGGIGTTSTWGRRFSPGTWLAEFEPDGLYTRIRAETGIVGRNYYVLMWLYILFRGMRIIMRQPENEAKYLGMAVMSGYAGILMANYGNSVLTQFPINIVTYLGLVFVELMYYWDDKGNLLPDADVPAAEIARIAEEQEQQ
jgi:hypothetical protein